MVIYTVSAVDINSDYPHQPEIVFYYLSLDKAKDASDEITAEYNDCITNGYDVELVDSETGETFTHPKSQYMSIGYVGVVEVIE